MSDLILVLNCGSSSIKFALFDASVQPLPRQPLWNGKVEGITGPAPTFGETGTVPGPVTLDSAQPYHAALEHIRTRVLARLGSHRIAAVAHRVVHGGAKYFDPVRVDAAVLADLKTYIPLAPLHQPFALEAIETLLATAPGLPQVACFDTAFHHTLPDVEKMLPLPYDAWERGLRRYGFHGLSYEFMSVALAERHGDAARGRTIVAHLGSGASLCAMQGLRSVATTMGFSALDGLMMGTRSPVSSSSPAGMRSVFTPKACSFLSKSSSVALSSTLKAKKSMPAWSAWRSTTLLWSRSERVLK